MPRCLFVVPHTHWDREWYEPAVRFRQRLVALLDVTLEQLQAGDLPVFLLDGQTVLLEDYLAVRPEREAHVAALVADGRLLLGPWYVLADELLPSDETLVRNLLVGRGHGQRWGGWLDLGYSPDAFGHPAALPTILAGFGIRHAILWRGYRGESDTAEDLFRWRGPDGSRVLVHHLPPAGYEVGANLPADRQALARRWNEIRVALERRAGRRDLVLMNGADHHAPQPDLAEVVRRLSGVAQGYRVRIASPTAYFDALPPEVRVPEVAGELRVAHRDAWVLQGTHGVRSRLKGAIGEGERLLLRWAEPQAACAWWAGGRDRRPDLGAAWREHLRNCFHDTRCGTTSDEVAADARRRARRVVSQARGILDDALHERLGQDPVEARRSPARWSPSLVVVNPSAADRDGVVEATITVFRRRVVVGRAATRKDARVAPRPPTVRLADAAGAPVPLQVLHRSTAYERLDSPRDYPLQDEVYAFRVALFARDVPALGMRAHAVEVGRARPAEVPASVQVRGHALTSPWCRVAARGPRGFIVEDRHRRQRWDGVCDVVSESDKGDLYTYEPGGAQPLPAAWGAARRMWSGPLVAAMARDFTVGRRVRGTVTARLDAASRLVRFVVEGVNRRGDHRLRLAFPLGAAARHGRTVADMHYGPVARQREDVDPRRFPREWPAATAPLHRYVSVPDALTVLVRGLYEYELAADGTLYVTLFRSVGALSRGDLAARPGHAAWPMPTPAAQELGAFRAELALATCSVDGDSEPAQWDRIERLAEEFHAPLAGRMLRHGIAVPAQVKGPALEGGGLAFKAAKISEDGRGLVLRCVNLTDRPVRGAWRLPDTGATVRWVRLDEGPEGVRRSARGPRVAFEAAPREVCSVLVTR